MQMRGWMGVGLLLAVVLLPGSAGAGPCHGEFCDPEPPPPPCAEVNTGFSEDGCPDDFASSAMEFCFDDRVPNASAYPNKDGSDGELFVLGNESADKQDCGIVLVKETGYYAIYDSELSESCGDQLDETGYITLHNSCNADGWATTRNVGERYLVLDRDNTGAGCATDSECQASYVCREGMNHGNCCVPEEPVYVGTFLLVAGEENVICIHHWCPEWKEYLSAGTDYGWVHDENVASANCTTVDSIHFKIAATAIVCRQEGYIQACAGGCVNGECLPHPCFEAGCEAYCRMSDDGEAQCVDENPCGGISCPNGCMFGLCLQDSSVQGEDGDDDGYPALADCNDSNAAVNPGATEDCDNGVDDDCSGFVDDCGGTSDGGNPLIDGGTAGTGGGGSGSASDPSSTSEDSGGCGCRLARGGGSAGLVLFGLLGWAVVFRRRRSRKTPH
jgi:Putative metal-binding motif